VATFREAGGRAIVLLVVAATAMAVDPLPADTAGAPPRTDGTAASSGDDYARFLDLMREVARAEGRVSDLRKDRDEVLARLRAERDQAVQASPPPAPRDDGFAAHYSREQERFAGKIHAAEVRLEALRQQAAQARAGLP